MDPAQLHPAPSLSDHFAEERTFLAWIRTGLALMGFGFVVARFGLFLQELQLVQPNAVHQSHQLSIWFGTALILVGVAANLYAARRHSHYVSQFSSGVVHTFRPSKHLALLAFFLALIGLAMAIYLALIHNPSPAPVTRTSISHSKETPMFATQEAAAKDNGIISKPSLHSVDETVAKLQSLLQSKGVAIFALVDHSGEAAKVGMTMLPTKLLIFGNPKGGTPVMVAAPTSALDLPLKILVWQDGQGQVWVSYNSLAHLQQRHNIPDALLANLAVVEALAAQASS
ncbi:MAG TPA: DUF302 domain-containing protein [Candidatus Methylomirabilis sp.]|nr:DUF302 domain-containing protein [Candidatus Methylomirabilis sp.]